METLCAEYTQSRALTDSLLIQAKKRYKSVSESFHDF